MRGIASNDYSIEKGPDNGSRGDVSFLSPASSDTVSSGPPFSRLLTAGDQVPLLSQGNQQACRVVVLCERRDRS